MDTSVDRLIAATQALLWERGYVGTSPKAIQARSGVGQGSMYHHFPSKAALARAAEERTVREVKESIEAQLAGPGDMTSKIVRYMSTPYRTALQGCPIGQLAADPDIMADPNLREPLTEAFEWTNATIAAAIAQAQQEGGIAASVDPVAAAELIQATRQGAYVYARALGAPSAFTRATSGLATMLGIAAQDGP